MKLFVITLSFFFAFPSFAVEIDQEQFPSFSGEIDQEQLPPFPKCSITCPKEYKGAGDTCTAVGKPGQSVRCYLEIDRIDNVCVARCKVY